MLDLQEEEEEVMEEVVEVTEEEEAAGPQVEEAVEENLEDPMEDLPLLKVEEEEVEEKQELEAVVKLQVEEVAVLEEEGENPASPALHLRSPSLATLVKAQVKMEFKNTSCNSQFSLISRKGYKNFFPGNIFAIFLPILFQGHSDVCS